MPESGLAFQWRPSGWLKSIADLKSINGVRGASFIFLAAASL